MATSDVLLFWLKFDTVSLKIKEFETCSGLCGVVKRCRGLTTSESIEKKHDTNFSFFDFYPCLSAQYQRNTAPKTSGYDCMTWFGPF